MVNNRAKSNNAAKSRPTHPGIDRLVVFVSLREDVVSHPSRPATTRRRVVKDGHYILP